MQEAPTGKSLLANPFWDLSSLHLSNSIMGTWCYYLIPPEVWEWRQQRADSFIKDPADSRSPKVWSLAPPRPAPPRPTDTPAAKTAPQFSLLYWALGPPTVSSWGRAICPSASVTPSIQPASTIRRSAPRRWPVGVARGPGAEVSAGGRRGRGAGSGGRANRARGSGPAAGARRPRARSRPGRAQRQAARAGGRGGRGASPS